MSRITVTVTDSHLSAISGVAARLRQKGMAVESELSALGVITGSIDDAEVSGLDSVEGVKSVSREGSFSVAPPDAEVQ